MGGGGTELLEILNENGVGTGIPKTRQEIHQNGLWHRAIIVAIVNNENKIFYEVDGELKCFIIHESD